MIPDEENKTPEENITEGMPKVDSTEVPIISANDSPESKEGESVLDTENGETAKKSEKELATEKEVEEVVEDVNPEGRLLYTKVWGGSSYPGASPKANFEIGAEAIRQLIVDGKIRFNIKEGEGFVVQTIYLLDEKE